MWIFTTYKCKVIILTCILSGNHCKFTTNNFKFKPYKYKFTPYKYEFTFYMYKYTLYKFKFTTSKYWFTSVNLQISSKNKNKTWKWNFFHLQVITNFFEGLKYITCHVNLKLILFTIKCV
jgi:hypothetical protein